MVLVSNEGEKFYAHRLMLCGQSPVFHSMMESEVWKNTNSQDGEVGVASYPGARGQKISAWYLLLAHALNIRVFYCKIFRLHHENMVAVILATSLPHLSY